MLGTIITLAVLAAVVGMIIYSMIKKHKSGSGGCSCGCGGCAMSEICHKDKDSQK